MFHIRLVARPDARMVEVPLEIEAALPRDFDGVVMLASSGLPRKVKIKAPSDALKLSTAYRLERMLGDVVRLTLRGNVQDNARVQDAARAYIKGVRERRRDGATLLVQGDGRGKVEVSESAAPGTASGPPPAGAVAALAAPAAAPVTAPPPAAAGSAGVSAAAGSVTEAPQSTPAAAPGPPAASSAAASSAAASSAQQPAGPPAPAAGSLADRILALERRLAEIELGVGAPDAVPGPKSRQPTAVDAFAEGLRSELRARATQLLGAADHAASTCDKAVWLAADAARQLGCDPEAPEQRELRRLAAEAGARQASLQMLVAELDLYSPAELLVGERLLERLAGKHAPEGAPAIDPSAQLASLAAQLLRAPTPRPGLGSWIESAAPLCGWTLVQPSAGDRLDRELHEPVDGPSPQGGTATVGRVVVAGVRRADGSLLARARVALAARPDGAGEDLIVSDRDVEEIHDLAGSSDKPFAPGGGRADGGTV